VGIIGAQLLMRKVILFHGLPSPSSGWRYHVCIADRAAALTPVAAARWPQ
jgi:hypothetical protein